MAEVDGTLIMSVMQAIRSDIAEIKRDMGDLTLRVHVLEDQTAAIAVALAGINHRLDGLKSDVGVIKRRLELVEA